MLTSPMAPIAVPGPCPDGEFGPQSQSERLLLALARSSYPELSYEQCTRERLTQIARHQGVDFATALFYDRIRRAPHNRALVQALETSGPEPSGPVARGRLLIVPALFYREHPETGGDGGLVATIAREAGLDAEVLPVGSGSSSRENARLLQQLLPARSSGPTVVVSLSKGAADLRLALESVRPPPALRAWVVVSGLLRPTPAIDRMLSRWWSRAALSWLLRRYDGSRELPDEFATGRGSILARPAVSPAGLRVINLVACPLSRHLGTRFGRMRHRQMAGSGPNDGMTLLRDAILEPGSVYPVWGADHYFRLPALPVLLRRLIVYLSSIDCLGRVTSADPAPAVSVPVATALSWRPR